MSRIDQTTAMRFRHLAIVAVILGTLLMVVQVQAASGDNQSAPKHVYGTEPRNDAAAVAAFQAIVPVLHDPRCMNCHSKGDYPRQGDSETRHRMNVVRGPSGEGIAPVDCSSCHLNHNVAGNDTPPGAPGWHLPSPDLPMIWEGLTDAQLCALLKDPKQNGHRDVDQIVEHLRTPLVQWGWHPGEGRKPIAMPFDQFEKYVNDWAAKGAACPATK